jgi:hypothetical protein
VRLGCKTSKHYFSSSGGSDAVSIKSALGHDTLNLCFCIRWDLRVSGVSGARNIDALFFMLRWDRYGFDKKRIGTRYDELVFLHLGESIGHVVHSAASEA